MIRRSCHFGGKIAVPTSPNIVIIMTDQQRADLSHREGFPLQTTPFQDNFARQGVWFNRAYTSMPACAPARVSMLTGRYPSATHVRTNWNIKDASFGQDLFDILHAQGYMTALCGKNHSHLTPDKTNFWYECSHLGIDSDDRAPQEKAFDDFLKTTHFHISMDPSPFPVECQIPYRLVTRAQSWVKSVKDKPFLLWLSFPEPHNPYQVPEPYYSMFPPESIPDPRAGVEALPVKGFKYEWCRQSFERAFPGYSDSIPRARANYLGMLRLLDDQIERFISFLDAQGLRENTVILILSDHGDFVGDYGLLRKGAGLSESLTRIPFQISGPGIQTLDQPNSAHVSICDILPTLCEAVRIPLPAGVQGRSLWPILTGADYPAEEFRSACVEHGFGGLYYTSDEPLDPREDGLTPSHDGQPGDYDCLNSWTQSGTMRMVRKDDWKLIYDMQGEGQLYDLSRDPSELENLYSHPEAAEKRAELLEEMLTWLLRIQDPLPLPRRRYVMKRDSRSYWTPYKT